MHKKIKIFICIVFIALLLLSLHFIYSDHEYELTDIEEIKTEEGYENIVYTVEEEKIDENVLGILTIEKINLKANVQEGCTSDILALYVGHIPETNKYDGNIGLAAHNRLNKYSYFARLNELEIDDEIVYETKFFKRKYKVIKKVVIYDTDWSYLENTKDNRLTMITCIKDKPNQRLCVQAIEEK